MDNLTDQAFAQIAKYFRALTDPHRLRILYTLRGGERNVGDLTELCGCSTANVSRHLATLANQGMVAREGRGTSVYYRIADATIYDMCEQVCGSIARHLESQASVHRTVSRGARKAATKSQGRAR